MQWTFEDGPTAGTTYEHRFPSDGSILFRPEGASKWATARRGSVLPVNPDVDVVSYISEQGYTLTAVLDRAAGTVTAVASNGEDWFAQTGTFEVVGAVRKAAPHRGRARNPSHAASARPAAVTRIAIAKAFR